MAEALKQNSSLTAIDLSSHGIGADGAKAAVLLRPSLAFMWPACLARPGTGRSREGKRLLQNFAPRMQSVRRIVIEGAGWGTVGPLEVQDLEDQELGLCVRCHEAI